MCLPKQVVVAHVALIHQVMYATACESSIPAYICDKFDSAHRQQIKELIYMTAVQLLWDSKIAQVGVFLHSDMDD